MKRDSNLSAGFTIIELIIATGVFSTVLLVGLAAFLQTGKLFYKGVTISQTQQVAHDILDSLKSEIQFSPSIVSTQSSTNGRSYLCVGNIRYTFKLYNQVSLDPTVHNFTDNFGLVRDVLPGSSGCGDPFSATPVPLDTTTETELLGSKMRLASLSITPAQDVNGDDITDLWSIAIKVAYGDDDVLDNPLTANPACNGGLNASQYCSVVELTSSVSRGY
jgi:type II secretory pathway pseudopilin PulG